MTKQEREAVLIDVCRFIQDGLRNEIPEWNMSNIHNGTIEVRRYQRYSENVRLSQRRGREYIDLHVYIKQTQGVGLPLRNTLIAKENDYRTAALNGTEVEWNNDPQGENSQCLVHYYVPVNWENWSALPDQQKNEVLGAFRALHNVANDAIGQMGDFVRRVGSMWQIYPANNVLRDGVLGQNDDDIAEMEHSTAKNVILYGPPGTGKTYSTVFRAVEIIDGVEAIEDMEYGDAKARYDELRAAGRIQMITFHQAYGYEEFIGGIRPESGENGTISYPVKPGVFVSFCKEALRDADNKYVFVIDEINRGNVAKIFGELITLIEESKRIGASGETRVAIPGFEKDPAGHNGEFEYERNFGVPGNVYILGTMNTADRSLAKLDAALRRRFDFDEIMPDCNLLPENVAGVNLREMLKVINRRIQFLVDREHQIGHAWLMGVTDMPSLRSAFRRKIIPLLQEYFYDDYSKIRKVLNDDAKRDPNLVFIQKLTPDNGLFVEEEEVERYEPNDLAFSSAAAYRSIYSMPVQQGQPPVIQQPAGQNGMGNN